MKSNSIRSCLWFDGQAKVAADFYCSVFKDSRITSVNPMVVTFELWGTKFMGLNGGPNFKFNPSISFFVTCESLDETNEIWSKIMQGGKALMPIDKYPWSERYGWTQDQFGLTWQISVVNKEGDKKKITPAMLFTSTNFGKAEEAVNFYTSVFEHSTIDTLIHYPEGDSNAGKIMYSEFKLDSNNIIAMDGPGVHEYVFNEAVSFVIDCNTQEEIDYYWNRLSEGGAEGQCGWLKDKFGVSWQIVPEVIGKLMTDPEKAGRVMQVVMQMKKLDLEKLVNA